MKEKLIKLIDLRSIVTLAMTIGLIYGFFVGKINSQEFLVFATMVYTFYFAKTDKEKNKGNE